MRSRSLRTSLAKAGPLVVGTLVCLPVHSSLRAAEEAPLGVEIADASGGCEWLVGSARDGDAPLPVLVTLSPDSLREPASVLDELIECSSTRRLAVAARLDPPTAWVQEADPYAAIRGWLADLEAFLQARQGKIRVFQIGHRPDQVFEPVSYLFLVEKVSTLIRSFDREAVVVAGPLGEGFEPWLDGIEPRRLAPYVDALALEDPVDLGTAMTRLAVDYPARPVWLHAGVGGVPGRFHAARAARVQTVFVAARPDEPGTRLALNVVQSLPSRFLPDTGPQPAGGLGFVDSLGPERALILAPGVTGPIDVGADPVTGARAVDLSTGTEIAVSATGPAAAPAEPQAEGGERAILTPAAAEGPLLVRYTVVKGPRAASETVGVTDAYEMSAEEIIARNRAHEAALGRAVKHYQARATISYHYRAESVGESIDVASVNRFFWRDGVGEYEETELFVNGARWRGRAPDLPFITPEKVKEVPLEIRLDESYLYRLEETKTIDGRQAYVVAFEPVETGRSLYSGRVWIDRETFARLKIYLVQHALKPPISSNNDTIAYAPVEAAGGTWWLPSSGYRQMIFTVLGRAVAVEREVSYEQIVVNSPEFEEGRQQAYASDRPILRDDETGYTRLVPGEGGTRVPQTDALQNTAFFGGISVGSDGDVGTPYGGINYFDFDWRGTGTQLDIAYAGALVDVAWTDPALGDSRWELTVEGRLSALPDNFKRVTRDGRVDEEDVEVLEEQAFVRVGRQLTVHQKGEVTVDLSYDNYSLADDTDPEFVLPPTRPITTGTARWKYARAGYVADIWFSSGHRFGWADWGLPTDPNAAPGAVQLTGDGSDDDFQRWGATLLKSFYPGRLQKIALGGSVYAGRDLDRFSRFRIGDFRNARVRGYNSFDITFDRGVSAQVSCLLTPPRGSLSVEIGVEGALLENDEDFDGRQYLAGSGAAVHMSGPWGTLLSLRAGVGLGSSIDASTSGFTIRAVMIKTFDHWPF